MRLYQAFRVMIKTKEKMQSTKKLTAKLGFFRLAGTNEHVGASPSKAGSHGVVHFFLTIVS